jgi:hypothetical protein
MKSLKKNFKKYVTKNNKPIKKDDNDEEITPIKKDDINEEIDKIINKYSELCENKINKDLVFDHFKNYGNFGLKGLNPYELISLFQFYGTCLKCGQANTWKNWCHGCNSKIFQEDFPNWTSGNKFIDNFIQKSQLQAKTFEVVEWIPYNHLRNIKYLAQGGFSTIFKVIWLDGAINCWDYENQQWNRDCYQVPEEAYEDARNLKRTLRNPIKDIETHGFPVALKSLINSSHISEEFLNEVSNFFNMLLYSNSNRFNIYFVVGNMFKRHV